MAKRIFDPDEHPERLQYLLQKVSCDKSITVAGSVANEGYIRSADAKKVIFDIPARLSDQRIADTEIQVSAQDFILERGEIYSSDMLMIQYSVDRGEKKGSMNYQNVNGVLLIVFMRHSSKPFKEAKTDRYIHRFNKEVSDSGIEYKPLRQVVYVELDKCLKQFLRGKDGENDEELQLLLSAMADINAKEVKERIQGSPFMMEIAGEVKQLAQSKEVQAMLLAEKYAIADTNAALSYAKNEGRVEERNNNLETVTQNLMQREGLSRKDAEEKAKLLFS